MSLTMLDSSLIREAAVRVIASKYFLHVMNTRKADTRADGNLKVSAAISKMMDSGDASRRTMVALETVTAAIPIDIRKSQAEKLVDRDDVLLNDVLNAMCAMSFNGIPTGDELGAKLTAFKKAQDALQAAREALATAIQPDVMAQVKQLVTKYAPCFDPEFVKAING